MRTHTTRLFAAALTAALTAGLTVVTGTAAIAETLPGITIPAPAHMTPPDENVFAAGTGVQTYDSAKADIRWQSLIDGRVAVRPACGSKGRGVYSGDTLACAGDSGTVTAYEVYGFKAGTTVRLPRPVGHQWALAHSATQVLSYAPTSSGDGVTLHLLGLNPATTANRAVALPGKMASRPEVLDFDDEGAFVTYSDGEKLVGGLVDFARAEMIPIPLYLGLSGRPDVSLSADWIIQYDDTTLTDVHLVSRRDGVTTRKVPLAKPEWSRSGEVRIVGDWLVAGFDGSPATWPLVGTSLADGEQRTLLSLATSQLVQGRDGALYAVGGADSSRWGVQRITLDGSGAPSTERVIATPPRPAERKSLSLAHGQVALTQYDGRAVTLQGFDVSLSTPPIVTPDPVWTCEPAWSETLCPQPNDGTTSKADEWPHSTGDGRMVSLAVGDDGMTCSSCVVLAHIKEAKPGGAMRTVRLKSSARLKAIRIISASGRYVHFIAMENYEYRSVVADIETGNVLRISGSSRESLWAGKLWTAGDSEDSISALDLATGQTSAQVDLGMACPAESLEVVGDWALATCRHGQDGHIFNRRTKIAVAFSRPNGGVMPRLGDGFVVYPIVGVPADSLELVNVRSGAAVRTRLTDSLALPNSGQGWTVDRFGTGVGWVSKDQTVHVVGVGGASSPLAVTDAITGTEVDGPAANPWRGSWRLSKPAASWAFTVTSTASGARVRTITGGEARGLIEVVWDGRDTTGAWVRNGAYTWELTASPGDGQGAALIVGGTSTAKGVTPGKRDHAASGGVPDGRDDLLALTSGGSMDFWHGTGTGRVSGKTAGAGWGKTADAAVPFGDVNADRCKDVLVRMSSGELRTYKPGCGKPLTPSVAYTKAGSGFGGMNVMTSPGDLTGDGRADLVARNGDSLYLYAGKAGGTVASGVKFGSGWSPFTHIVGVGDLNNDGNGDLIARKSDGSLYRYDGAGAGRLKAGVKIKSGWGASYTTLVGVGDLDGDGKPDLVARDRAGLLFRMSGDGRGSFGTAVQIGTGWGSFAGLH
ncbi:FG-GAP-like repeat-containing protein [Streptomyces sp. NPDC048629]|uniref:FG-GAP-like repeat-containing protein n=1 Tax=Streptomyces sp. NPDC048629 TaxID=3154824 RepID=UPI0034399018